MKRQKHNTSDRHTILGEPDLNGKIPVLLNKTGRSVDRIDDPNAAFGEAAFEVVVLLFGQDRVIGKSGFEAVNNDPAGLFIGDRYRFVTIIDTQLLLGLKISCVMFEDLFSGDSCQFDGGSKLVLQHYLQRITPHARAEART